MMSEVMGFNQYKVVDLNTGIIHVSFSNQLSKDFVYEILDREWEFVSDGVRGPESSGEVGSAVNATAKWAECSESDVVQIAANRHLDKTTKSTAWAVGLFRGTQDLPMPWFRWGLVVWGSENWWKRQFCDLKNFASSIGGHFGFRFTESNHSSICWHTGCHCPDSRFLLEFAMKSPDIWGRYGLEGAARNNFWTVSGSWLKWSSRELVKTVYLISFIAHKMGIIQMKLMNERNNGEIADVW